MAHSAQLPGSGHSATRLLANRRRRRHSFAHSARQLDRQPDRQAASQPDKLRRRQPRRAPCNANKLELAADKETFSHKRSQQTSWLTSQVSSLKLTAALLRFYAYAYAYCYIAARRRPNQLGSPV